MIESDTVTSTDIDGNDWAAYFVGFDYESGFGLVRTERPIRLKPLTFGDFDTLELRSEAYVAGLGGRRRRSRSRSPAGRVRRLLGVPSRQCNLHRAGLSAVGRLGPDRPGRRAAGYRLAPCPGSARSGRAGFPRRHVRAHQPPEADFQELVSKGHLATRASLAWPTPSSTWASSWSAA